jgi:DNA-binding response OmpR family regulator
MGRQRILAVVQTDLQLICSMRSALEESGLGSLSIARNSQEAILYLRGVGIYADRRRYPLPGIVLLDCTNADGGDLEVLGWMRERAEFQSMPVIMLCTEEHRHVHVTCALDAACLIADRRDLLEIAEAVESLAVQSLVAVSA